VPRHASVVERLDALERDPDRIGVVAVRRKGAAGNARLDPLEARAKRAAADPVASSARSFKTDALQMV
jgi:hypothetical protein